MSNEHYYNNKKAAESKRRKVLFLCTGNSCRSQIAEAIVNNRLSECWDAFSGGTQPIGFIHPNALAALAEIGIQHHGRSKHVDEYQGVDFDLVVTVCDDAAENCPTWFGLGNCVHLSFPDPAQACGNDEDILAVFNQVRDDIDRQVLNLLNIQFP
jgi:arsenate reductase